MEAGEAPPASRQFKTLWFDDNFDGDFTDEKIKAGARATERGPKKLNDIYNAHENGDNITTFWMSLVDEDADPTSNFGKVDVIGGTVTATDTDVEPDGMADNMTGDRSDVADCGDDGCDAKIDMEFTLKFTDGLYGCEVEEMVTLECTWDAQGGFEVDGQGAVTSAFAGLVAGTNLAQFLQCEDIE